MPYFPGFGAVTAAKLQEWRAELSSRAMVERSARVLCRSLRKFISVFCCSDAAKNLRLRISARLAVAQKKNSGQKAAVPGGNRNEEFLLSAPAGNLERQFVDIAAGQTDVVKLVIAEPRKRIVRSAIFFPQNHGTDS